MVRKSTMNKVGVQERAKIIYGFLDADTGVGDAGVAARRGIVISMMPVRGV
jgi:hypothetical protein